MGPYHSSALCATRIPWCCAMHPYSLHLQPRHPRLVGCRPLPCPPCGPRSTPCSRHSLQPAGCSWSSGSPVRAASAPQPWPGIRSAGDSNTRTASVSEGLLASLTALYTVNTISLKRTAATHTDQPADVPMPRQDRCHCTYHMRSDTLPREPTMTCRAPPLPFAGLVRSSVAHTRLPFSLSPATWHACSLHQGVVATKD